MASLSEQEYLVDGAQLLGINLAQSKVEQLMDYLALFEKWNKAFNLSAIREPIDMVKLHLLDSLSVSSHITGNNILDVGTGGGLPGIPLAIMYPKRNFTLLDSAGKKTRFLVQVVQSLGLYNVTVVNDRVERFQPAQLFDGIVSRAFASLQDMTSQCQHLLAEGGYFWAMKGLYPQEELRLIEKHYRVEACHELRVPGLEAQRCLLCLSPLPASAQEAEPSA